MGVAVTYKVCRVLGKVWIGLAAAVIVLGNVGTLFVRGLGALQEHLSPFNVGYYIGVAIALTPGVLLLTAAELLKKGNRKGAFTALAVVPVALAGVLGMSALVLSERAVKKAPKNDDRVREYKATAVLAFQIKDP